MVPSWVFDVDEFDDSLLTDLTVFEELDMDLLQIEKTSLFIVSYPWVFLQAYLQSNDIEVEHPLAKRSKVDFWGPFAVVSLYCGILWIGGVKNIPWIIPIWGSFAFLSHLVARVSFKSTYIIHVSILGYSLVPVIPFCSLVMIFHPSEWYSLIFQMLLLMWSLLSLYVSFRDLLYTKVSITPPPPVSFVFTFIADFLIYSFANRIRLRL